VNADGEHAQFFLGNCQPLFNEISSKLDKLAQAIAAGEKDREVMVAEMRDMKQMVKSHDKFIAAWKVHAWWLGFVGGIAVTVGSAVIASLIVRAAAGG
jgi:uncharacterized protein YfkK (UPF0435 family)